MNEDAPTGGPSDEEAVCKEFEAILAGLFERVRPALASAPTWRDRIRVAMYTLVEFAAEDPARAELFFLDPREGGERLALLREQGFALAVQLIDEGRSELDDPESMSLVTAEALGGAVYGQIRRAVRRGALTTDLVPQLLYTIVLPYLGIEAAEEELHRLPPPGTGMSDGS
jgi:hypothetical protein